MLSGWKLLAVSCPICNTALLSKGEQTRCPCCDLPVLLEKDALEERNYTAIDQAWTNTAESKKSEATSANDTPVYEPTSFEELKKEYDIKNKRKNAVSEKLGEKMVSGWTMLANSCPKAECNGTPLMSCGGGPMVCVCCDSEYSVSSFGDLVQSNSASCVASADASSQGKSTAVVREDRTPSDEESISDFGGFDFDSEVPVLALSSFAADADDASQKISQRLLQGWALLDEVCSSATCRGSTPLMRDRDGHKCCVECGHTADSNGAARLASAPSVKAAAPARVPVAAARAADSGGGGDEDGDDSDDNVEEFFADWRSRIREGSSKAAVKRSASPGGEDRHPAGASRSAVPRALAVLHKRLSAATDSLDGCESVEQSTKLAGLIAQLCAAIRSAQECRNLEN